MAEIGWIKLHRKIQECFIWDDEEDEPFDRRSAWIDLLLLANHADKRTVFDGKAITVKKGQRITSLRKLAERWHWSIGKVVRYLNMLEGEGMIIRESDTKKTLLTVVNYGIYQDVRDTDRYTNGTPTDTPTEHRRNTDGTQTETNKNDKNDKNEKEVCGKFAHVLLTPEEHQLLIGEYGASITEDAIEFLDGYIERKGYKDKNHYVCIRQWVVKAVKERKEKGDGMMKNNFDYNAIEDVLLGHKGGKNGEEQ